MPTWVVIDVEEVFIPAAVMTTHHKRALQEFGEVPFSVICLHSHVRIPGSDSLSLSPLSFGPKLPSSTVTDCMELSNNSAPSESVLNDGGQSILNGIGIIEGLHHDIDDESSNALYTQ